MPDTKIKLRSNEVIFEVHTRQENVDSKYTSTSTAADFVVENREVLYGSDVCSVPAGVMKNVWEQLKSRELYGNCDKSK
jgi:hypothetical protein